jgi:RNA polymerase sigma factor (sigma-70 family)
MPAAAIRVPLVRARLGRVDDERLAALAAEGDERAFEAVYDRHHRALLGYCRHFLGSVDEAEDALQQTFLRAHRALLAHGAPDELRPWLFAIARNRCKTLVAARRPDAPEDEAAEPSTDGLRSEVEDRADLRALLADVAALPEDQRSALVLAELADMPHAEIGAVIGVPATKVKALVHQARTRLIAEGEARETPCEQVRLQLATARGGELRRGPLRRHLRGCEPCRAYRAAIAEQRAALGLLLPVVPAAGLKAAVLGAAAGGGGGGSAAAVGGATAAAGATASGTGSSGLLAGGLGAKLGVGAVLVGGAGGGAVAVEEIAHDPPREAPRAGLVRAPAATPESTPGEGSARPVVATTGAPSAPRTESRAAGRRGRKQRSAGRGGTSGSRGRSDSSNASPQGVERSSGAPGQLKTGPGPATGRGQTAKQGAAAQPQGRAVRRRPQAPPAGPAKTPPGQAAKPEKTEKAARPAKPLNAATPAPVEAPAKANGKKFTAEALP